MADEVDLGKLTVSQLVEAVVDAAEEYCEARQRNDTSASSANLQAAKNVLLGSVEEMLILLADIPDFLRTHDGGRAQQIRDLLAKYGRRPL